MAFSSGHHASVPNYSACHSSHVSRSETGHSIMWSSTFLPKLSFSTGSQMITLLLGRGPSGDQGSLLWELLWVWPWLWALLQLQLLLLEWLLLQVWEQVHDLPLLPELNLSISLQRASTASNTLWQATLRASSYGSHLLSLGHCSSSCSMPLVVVVGHPCL